MSWSKWVVGIHTPLADKVGLHAMACGEVEACWRRSRARAKVVDSGSNSPATLIRYEAGYEGFRPGSGQQLWPFSLFTFAAG